jgi:hypothetical protein
MFSRMVWHFFRIAAAGCFAGALGAAFAAAGSKAARDSLVYKDGDRVYGVVVEKTADTIVFKSDRFGELRVKTGEAVIVPADEPPVAAKPAKAATVAARPAAPPAPAATPAEVAEQDRLTVWDRFSPSVLTSRVRGFMGPWNGRLTLSLDAVNDVAERNTVSVETKLSRKWEKDEMRLAVRYDYAETDNVPTTDLVKLSGTWRRDFSKKQFAQYRPTFEINRAAKRGGRPNDYMLLQQEIGVGYNVTSTPARKVRVGVSQNLFDLWPLTSTGEHSSRGVQSAFEEVELKLPWRMGLTQRGVWYPVKSDDHGWEHRIELNKKLTETLSTALRHEIRRNNPDGSAQDYDRLKVLFGLDF